MNRALIIIALVIFTTFGAAQAGITSRYKTLAADTELYTEGSLYVVTEVSEADAHYHSYEKIINKPIILNEVMSYKEDGFIGFSGTTYGWEFGFDNKIAFYEAKIKPYGATNSDYSALDADTDTAFSDEDFVIAGEDNVVISGMKIGSGMMTVSETKLADSGYVASVIDGNLAWSNGGDWVPVATGTSVIYADPHLVFDAKSIDMTSVTEIKLSDEIKQQLKSEVEKMVFHASLTWGTWFMIFVLAVIAAKIAHRITLKTVFRPTKWAARKAEKAAKETAETVKKEWGES